MRKATHANKSFLTGTAFLAVGVIAIVFLFLDQSFRLSAGKKEVIRQDTFEFVFTSDFEGQSLTVYLNDSLIATHVHAADTVRHCRLAEESSLLLVDSATQRVMVVDVPVKSGVYPVRKHSPR